LVLALMLLSPKYLRSPCLFFSRLWQYTDTFIVWEHIDHPYWLSRQYSRKRCTVFLARNGASFVWWRVPERDHESRWWTGRVVFVAVLLLQVCMNPSLSPYFAFGITWSDDCNSPATNLTAQMRGKSEIEDGVWKRVFADEWLVWPGDSVKNVFSLDIPTGKWYNNWVVTPGQQGNAAGQKPFGGGFVFDPAVDSESPFRSSHDKACWFQSIAETKGAPYTNVSPLRTSIWNVVNVLTNDSKQALLTIELQDLGTWDFGSVLWTNVILEANTTDTAWCTK
jgi:hypothetical protein